MAVLGLRRARVRIPLLAALVSFASLAAIALVTRTVQRTQTFAQLDEELDTLVDAFASEIELRGLQDIHHDTLRKGLESSVLEFQLEHHSALLLRGNEVLAHTGDVSPDVKTISIAELGTLDRTPFTATETFTGRRRVCRFEGANLSDRAEGTTLVVFRPIEGPLRTLRSFDRALVGMVIAGSLLSGFILILATRQALLPVQRMTCVAQEIGAHDLTRRLPARKGAEEFVRLATVINGLLARLEQAFASQRRLTADAAHELKTPVSVIVAETQEALRPESTAAERDASLHTVLDAARGMASGVDDLLELTRSEAGDLARHEPVPLGEVLEEAVLQVMPLARLKRSPVRCDCPEGLTLQGDRPGLTRMLRNLLRNALQYSSAGSEVEVSGGQEGDIAWLEVRDRGRGIPEADRARVFDRFVRLSGGRSSNPQGSGLGLAIVAEVVQRHGGRITIGDRQGGGAVFRVELPIG